MDVADYFGSGYGDDYLDYPGYMGTSAPAPQEQPAPSMGKRVAIQPNDAPVTAPSTVSTKVCKVNAKDKVIDFTSRLIPANPDDFAMIHGCGGSGHAPNSTIRVTLCDFTKGTGENSVTVSYALDVEYFPLLLKAAEDARLGRLKSQSTISAAQLSTCNAILGEMRNWAATPPIYPNPGAPAYTPVLQERLMEVGRALSGVLSVSQPENGSDCPFAFAKEKANPYKKGPDGFAPVSKILVQYQPTKPNGEASRYPWYIRVDNFEATLKERANGATAYSSDGARKQRSAFINISEDDFFTAMVAVERFIRVWEAGKASVVADGCRRADEAAKAWAAQNENSRI